MKWYSRRPGRPQGAKTKQETPGKKRARAFMDLQLEENLRPTKAATFTSEKYGVEAAQIFKDASRHRESIEVEAWADAEKAKRDYEEMLAATIGPQMPSDSRTLFSWAIRIALKGQSI